MLPEPQEWKHPFSITNSVKRDHLPASAKVPRNEVIEGTTHGDSRFIDMTVDAIQRLEVETVSPDDEGRTIGIRVRLAREKVRYYCRDVGYVIGASKGRLTQYLMVQYLPGGQVHGYPISEQEYQDELRELGEGDA